METNTSKTLDDETDLVFAREIVDEKTLDPSWSSPETLHDHLHPSNHPLTLTDLDKDQNNDDDDDYEEIYRDTRPISSSYGRYNWGSSLLSRPVEKHWPIQIKPTGVGAGLENLGNTCFINAILQCFTHTLPLVQALRSFDHPRPCDGATEGFCVICALRDHIELSLASSGKVLSPRKLVDNLNYISSFFQRYQQEDAHEFLQCLLDRLESCCLDSKTKDESLSSQGDNIVQRVFGGCLISKLQCCNCGSCSDTYEPLIDLSLEIEDVGSLGSALESFTKLEKIEDPETKFTCEKCKEQVSVEKQLMLDKVPSVAAFHLKRFKTDGSYVVKIDKHVEFPLELDLKPYTSGGQNSDVELKYHLYAIVEHMGSSPTCGHYFSYIRSSPDTWHRLNDSRVTRVEEEFVLSQDAYILFYAKQGTEWVSSLLEAESIGMNADISNSSPKSVLDNVENDYTSRSGVANAESCKANEPSASAGDSSTKFSCQLRSIDLEVNETRDTVKGMSACFTLASYRNAAEHETRDNTPMIDDASRPLSASDFYGVFCNEKVNKLTSLEEDNCNPGVEKVKIVDGFHPLTPPRSPSPDIHSGKPRETYQVPREHLKLESKGACKTQLERNGKDLERQEAVRCIKKTMTGERYMKLMAAVNDVSLNRKRRLKSSPCKRFSPTRARRKHNHGSVMRRVAI